jgi:osmotically inducible protein OsmC
MIRKSTAVWNGTGKDGKGALTTTSGALNNMPYSFSTLLYHGFKLSAEQWWFYTG